MLYIIHALDKPDALPRRLAAYAAHRAFLGDCGRFGVTNVMSGPLVADDGETMCGSLLLVEAADRATVERFSAADPFRAADVWQAVTITAFQRRLG